MSKEGGPSKEVAALDDTFDALLAELARASGPRSWPNAPQLHAGTNLLDGRLRVVRRIGEGGMGVVYEAYDTQRKGSVGLKTLHRLDATSVYRLKNEFRALADVTHENLVRLYELFAESDLWFFTMELVTGDRFDTWVRPEGALDEQRLRSALPQLAAAMDTIHDAGKLHRDLKPSNVLVSPEGRVVVLDFGLAIDPEVGGIGQTVMDESVSGTPGYMAPEQAAGSPATAASDFYALGVMLFEALTGRLPFEGRVGEMLAAKQSQAAPRASTLSGPVPEDLDQLCAELLSRTPEARPGITALRPRLSLAHTTSTESLRAGSHPAVRVRANDADSVGIELLGREPELSALHGGFTATLAGTPVVMFVSGESGMGKSALCTEFLNELRVHGRATVLSGRCYERENVPFKGFDALVDDLSRHLRRLSTVDATAVMPREVFALARIFPVLDRIASVAAAPRKDVPDPQDLKRRAFDAFGELLARMRDRAPLTLWLDDAQWLDHDSVRFLRALLVHPDPVPLLLILAHRSEGAEENSLLQAVLQGARDNAKLEVRELRVGPLPHAALCALTQRLLPHDAQAGAADALAGEAQGSPFFAAELARAAALRDFAEPAPTLSQALSLHVAALPLGAQQILSLLALAGQPLVAEVVVDAARAADGHESLDRLRTEKLVRVSIDAAGTRSVECYHDKIREHLVATLEPQQAGELTLALARVLESRTGDAELIARMLDVAGLQAEAAVHAALAAEAAFTALAFDRSAQLYARAIEHGHFEPERLQTLRLGRATALAHAGRAEAAEAYLSAAQHATGEPKHDLELKAGEQYLLHGDLDHGRALLDRALRHVGRSLPQSLPAAIASVVWSRARLKLRGLSFTPQTQHDASTLRELELLRTTVACLVRSDQLRAADFSARYVRRALDAGHTVELARALAWEVLFRSSMSAPEAEITAVLSLCAELCERTGDRLAQSWLWYCRGIDAMQRRGRPDEGLADLDSFIAFLASESQPSAGYDRAWGQYFRAGFLVCLGRIAEAGELAATQLEDALSRGDYNVAGALMQMCCFGLIAAGRTEEAERLLADARARLRPSEITVIDVWWLCARWIVGCYAGRALEAWTETAEHRGRFFDSWQGRIMLAGMMRPTAAGAAVAAAQAATDPDQRHELEREARRMVQSARKAPPSALAIVPADGLLACLDGDRDRAIVALRRSIPSRGGPMYTQILRRRLGELLGGDEGMALIAEADTFLRAGGVVDPARMTAAFAPGVAIVEG